LIFFPRYQYLIGSAPGVNGKKLQFAESEARAQIA